MTSFLTLAALLVGSALVSEGSFIKRQYSSKDPDMCTATLYMECVMPHLAQYEASLSSEAAVVAVLGDRAQLGALAADVTAASDCVDEKLTSAQCQGVDLEDSGWDALKLMAGFLETPANLDLIVAASSSPCVTDESKQESVGMSVVMCYLSFMEHMQQQQDFCVGLEHLETCAVSAVRLGCGEPAGALTQSVWNYVKQPEVHGYLLDMMEMSEVTSLVSNCHQRAAIVRRLAKRAIDKIRSK